MTFTCYHRLPRLDTAAQRSIFEQALERVRHWYGFYINGYVVMPEHVHRLVSEPERGELSTAIQILKQIVSRRLGSGLRVECVWCSSVLFFVRVPRWPTLRPGARES